MDIQTLWIVVLSIATPIAGIVGFAIQLREVKKGHLEVEKLQLEVAELKAKAMEADKRIVQVSTEEVRRFSTRDVMFSRGRSTNEAAPPTEQRTSLKEYLLVGAIILSLLFIGSYFLYDMYRFSLWLSAKF